MKSLSIKKYMLYFSTILFLGCSTSPSQNYAGNGRGDAPEAIDKRQVYKPKLPFDPAGLNPHLLDTGTASISGITCATRPGTGGFSPAANQDIILVPYTPYVAEALNLKIKTRNKDWNKVRLDIDQRTFSNRIQGKTNARGEFSFRNLKPGRYLILTDYDSAQSVIKYEPYSQYDGRTNTLYHWSQAQQYDYSTFNVLTADVTIKTIGQQMTGVVVKQRGQFINVVDVACRVHSSLQS